MSDDDLTEAIAAIRPYMGCCVDCPHEHSGVDVVDAQALLAAALPHLEQQIRDQVAAEIEGMAREVLNRDTSTSLDRDHNQGEADQLRAIAARIARTRKDT